MANMTMYSFHRMIIDNITKAHWSLLENITLYSVVELTAYEL